MKIKDIDLGKYPVLLAPMEDVTAPAFRLMCKGFGADMVYTEFVSSDALIRSVSKTEQKLNISDEERPVAIQIYGKDTDTMVEAARIVEQARPDILDINFGCPEKRVAGKGAGAGMLKNIPKMLEITRAVATAGYHVIMASYTPQKAENVCQRLMKETGNPNLEVLAIDLSSMHSVASFTDRILERKLSISLLMNNAGTMETGFSITNDGFERTVSVNYVGPYLLTRKLVPTMASGARIVNMVSCTYAIGRLDFPDFFLRGKKGSFWRIPVYRNTKLALTLFTLELAARVKERGIVVNAADPGIVSTDIITMHMWFDPLTDIFFRPFIRTPRQGAATAIGLLLDEEAGKRTGTLNVSGHAVRLSGKYLPHVQQQELWERTEEIVKKWL